MTPTDKAMTPTDEQLAIIEAVSSNPSSLMISAYAGTAKTTTLQLAAPGIPYRALALAFNKKIADELRGRLPQNYFVKTLNSLGHGALARTLQVQSVKLDDRKVGKLVSQVAKDNRLNLPTHLWDATRSLVGDAMQAGIVPSSEGPFLEPLLSDTPENWSAIFDGSSDDFPLCYDLARQVLIESIAVTRRGIISFDDQIYYPTVINGIWDHFSMIFVDESQDLSPLNHRMLELSAMPHGSRVVAVGDSRQAIYAFRGADASSMQTMRRLSKEWSDLPLTMTFRCPKSVVARQQSHAPGYRAFDGCVDGWFDSGFRRAEDHPWFDTLNGTCWEFPDLSSHLASHNLQTISVLCRNNAPLLSLAFKLLRRNIGCHMLGRDIGKGLSNLTKKLSHDDPSTRITKFLTDLTEWAETQSSIALANDQPTKSERIRDQEESLRAVAEGAGAKTVGDLQSALDNLFSRQGGLITLSSIHRAKGLEWDCVIHLDPFRIPSRQALRDPVQLEQENNLRYVAETRTRHTLLNLNLEDFR